MIFAALAENCTPSAQINCHATWKEEEGFLLPSRPLCTKSAFPYLKKYAATLSWRTVSHRVVGATAHRIAMLQWSLESVRVCGGPSGRRGSKVSNSGQRMTIREGCSCAMNVPRSGRSFLTTSRGRTYTYGLVPLASESRQHISHTVATPHSL